MLIVVVCTLVACQENDIAKVKAMFNETDVDVEVADSVKFTYKEDGFIKAIITSKTVRRYTNTQNKLEFPNGLLVKFYEQLTLVSVLKADYAQNDEATQTIKVSGNVYMENSRNEILETQELIWHTQTKKINTVYWGCLGLLYWCWAGCYLLGTTPYMALSPNQSRW